MRSSTAPNLSMKESKIPIENLYFLLCYAWDRLEERDLVNIAAKDHSQLLDLLANVLLNGTTYLLKRGLDHDYLPHSLTYAGVKGKLLLPQTLKRNLLPHNQTVCEFDEFSPNILHNQILKTTIECLLRCEGIEKGLQSGLRKLIPRFGGVASLPLTEKHFRAVRLHRNNAFYGFLLDICEVIHQNLLVNEQTGTYQFRDFWRDAKQMARLFEAFVRNFYRKEIPTAKVYRENIRWQVETSQADYRLLPTMQTDISIELPSRKVLIDTKFYVETFQQYFDAQKIHSQHLYQLFAYLQNHPDAQEGILLYPVVNQKISATYQQHQQKIRVETIDLNQPWRQIRADLLQILLPLASLDPSEGVQEPFIY